MMMICRSLVILSAAYVRADAEALLQIIEIDKGQATAALAQASTTAPEVTTAAAVSKAVPTEKTTPELPSTTVAAASDHWTTATPAEDTTAVPEGTTAASEAKGNIDVTTRAPSDETTAALDSTTTVAVVMSHKWWRVGVCAALVSNALSSTGIVMQRIAHLRELECSECGDAAGARQSGVFYAAGVAVYIGGAPLDELSYFLAPQVVCSTIGCFRIVLLTVLAWFCLKEAMGPRTIAGVAICSLGTCICLLSSPEENKKSASSTHGLYHKRSEPYLVLGVAFVIILVILDHTLDCWGKGVRRREALRAFVLSFVTAFSFALEKVINTELGFAQMPDDMWSASTWLLLVGANIAFGLLNLYLNLRGVRLLPVKVFVPLVVGFGMVLRLFQSVCILDEFRGATHSSMVLSLLGACFALLGALLVQTENDLENRPERIEGDAAALGCDEGIL